MPKPRFAEPRLHSIVLALAAATMLAGTAITSAHAQTAPAQPPPTDGPGAMIIFDGSGSMWGRIDGDKKAAKFELAREALRAALAKAPANVRTGLMSFGHRRGGDCSDIEVIAPLAAADAARILTPLDKLNPRGKGPIADALRQAAKAIGSAPQTSIVLIHDNADNCRQDPCDAIADIAAANPGLKVHVVSIGIEKEELARVACISKVTGGQAFDVKDAAAMPAALADAMAVALLNQAPGAADTAVAAAPAQAKPAGSKAAPVGPPGLRLSAQLAARPGAPAVAVRWRVLKTEGEAPVFEATGSDVVAPLPAGSYLVEAASGFITVRQGAVAAEQGPSPVEVALAAGALQVHARDLKDGPLSPSALVSLKAAGEGAPPSRPLWIGRAKDLDLVLAPGAYRVRISDGLVEREEAVTLAAGEAKALEVVLGAGRLELTAVAKPDGEPLEQVTFLLARDDPEAPDGRREIARSAATRPVFVLPAGTYYVTARAGSAEVRQRIGIGAGDTVKRAVSLGLAKLTVSSDVPSARKEPAAANLPAKLPIATRILSLDGEPREIARSTAVAPEFSLAAGRYRIEAAIGTLNVKAVQDIDIEAGSSRRLALKLDANTLTLKLAAAPAGGPPAVTWELRDAKGSVVTRTQQASPRLILAPGRYTARLEAGDKRAEKQVDLAADGQPRLVEFALP